MSGERPRVFLALPLSDDQLKPLDGSEVVRRKATGPVSTDELTEMLSDVDGYLGSAQVKIPNDVIDAATRLRVISNFGVGFDNVDLEHARSRGIDVCNTPGVLSGAVADLTLGLILQLARGLGGAQAMVREGRWVRGAAPSLGTDLKGKTLSIIGMGRIGLEVARRAQAFGMRVLFYDLRGDCEAPAGAECASGFEEALREADFLSIHTNLTPESHHLIGAAELSMMRPSAYILNTARGPIVDQSALYEALKDERIAGAALDVLEVEPPEPDEPLLALPNVIVTPHIGSATRETRDAMARLAVQNLADCLAGRPCANVVNRGL